MSYPPSYDECQILFEELKSLDSATGHEYNKRKYEIIHDLAEGQFLESKSYFIAGLTNPDPDYRRSCISALVTHWRQDDPEIVSRLLDMAHNDLDMLVRMIAVHSLGLLKREDSLELLNELSNNDLEDSDLRNTALKAIKLIKDPNYLLP